MDDSRSVPILPLLLKNSVRFFNNFIAIHIFITFYFIIFVIFVLLICYRFLKIG